ncbi:splicing factor, Prp19-binding domain-containing protein [Dichotomocladium elegans]|nr:splicing factor, Prp19-binding domain-containing protein [Dichotomocladium elegans]
MSFRPHNQSRPTQQARRYRAGQVPENYVDELSESEEEEEEQQQQIQRKREDDHRRPEQKHYQQQQLQFAQKEVVTGLKQIEISEKEAAGDRRLRRLKQQQQQAESADKDDIGRRRRRFTEEKDNEDEAIDNKKEEEEEEERRLRIKQRALQQQREQEAAQQEESEEEEGSEEEVRQNDFARDIGLIYIGVVQSSSEYETASSDEEDVIRRMPKPMFIPKAHRETILQEEQRRKEEEERERKWEEEMEARKQESHAMLAEELKREKEAELEKDLSTYDMSVDDTDHGDQAEFDAWKVRELKRIKRDREERIAREREQEEIERRRELPEDVRLKLDLEEAEKTRQKEKGQHTFMQKYYHKGAFFRGTDEDDVLKRDYSAPTVDEVRRKDLLPKVMQVKNFGLAGRTKWTHLVNEDTSSRDDPWNKPVHRHDSNSRKRGPSHDGDSFKRRRRD